MQVRVAPPPVPVMVIVYVPAGVEDVEIAIVDEKLGVPEDGLKLMLAPVGTCVVQLEGFDEYVAPQESHQ